MVCFGMRASRLLSIQMMLQARGRMTARALAEALEVSIRTLYRDVDQLSAAGVPVYAERGRHGGFALLEGWKTSLTGLTASESQAVFLSGLAGPAAQLGLRDEARTARLKLLAAMPASTREQAQHFSDRFHFDPLDWYRDQEPVPHLAVVAGAVAAQHLLRVRYESWKATSSRNLNPLGLVLKAGVWYLVASATGRPVAEAQPRTYRVSNILDAEALDEPCQRPSDFDLAAYWEASLQRFERELYRDEATVSASAAGLKRLRQLSSRIARAVAAAAPAGADGRVRLSLPIESPDEASRQLMALAPEVEVLAPAALRRAVAQRLREGLACYGDAMASSMAFKPSASARR